MPNYQNCLIIDTETNGDKDNPLCIEIAWVIYSIKDKTMLNCGSFLVNSGIENKATLINKIPSPVPTDLNSELVLDILRSAILLQQEDSIDFIVAHNKEFDSKMIESTFIDGDDYSYFGIPWLCTHSDFQLFPPEYNGKRDLTSLAQFYGVGISATHRAIYDCLLITEVFNRVPDLQKAFEIAVERSKKRLIVALTSYEEKKTVKQHGFHWNEGNGYFTKVVPTIELNPSDYPFDTINSPYYHQDIDELIKIMIETQTVLIRADVSYDNRELAKKQGFKWQNGQWIKRVLNTTQITDYPFKINVLGKERVG